MFLRNCVSKSDIYEGSEKMNGPQAKKNQFKVQAMKKSIRSMKAKNQKFLRRIKNTQKGSEINHEVIHYFIKT